MPTLSTPSRPKEATLFRNNRSQAVRIPVEFELPGDRVPYLPGFHVAKLR